MNSEWVPITLFFSIAACLIVFLYLRHISRIRKMDTVLKLAEQGGEVTEQMLQLLSENKTPVNDMRRGLILTAVSVPVILGFIMQGNWSAAMFVGGIPLFAGLAYLAVMKYGYSKEGDRQVLD
mgnify:CR=1 FL=1